MYIKAEVLSEKELKIVHENTLELLEKYGISMQYEPARKLFLEHGATCEGDRIKIPAELLKKALKSAPSTFSVIGRSKERNINIGGNNATVFGSAAGAVYVSDYINGRRPASFQDLKNMLALTQSSPYAGVVCAGTLYPSDVNPEEGLNMAIMEAILHSDKPLVGLAQDSMVSDTSINLAKIATEGKGEYYTIGIVNSLSPMAWDEKMLGSIMTYAKHRQPLVIACCSMAGFTSPTTLIGTIIQNNAEIVAGIALAQLVNPGTPVIYGNTSTITDMLSMNLCIGAPEYALISTAVGQLAKLYDIPFRSGGGLTDSKEIDMQAGIEAATNLLFTVANDVHLAFHSMGIMESFMSISYEKWIMDEEIIERILRLKNDNLQIMENPVDMIGLAMRGSGSFIDNEDTIMNFRKEFLRTKISDRNNYDVWKKRDTSIQKIAHEAWQKRLKEFVAPELPNYVKRELEQYLAKKDVK